MGQSMSRVDIYLPFSSARIGRRPSHRMDWRMSGIGHPLAGGRSLLEMARSMFTTPCAFR